jgi:hypothetical protein
VKVDTINILQNFWVLVVFDFYLRMEIMGEMLFLSEVVTVGISRGFNYRDDIVN